MNYENSSFINNENAILNMPSYLSNFQLMYFLIWILLFTDTDYEYIVIREYWIPCSK